MSKLILPLVAALFLSSCALSGPTAQKCGRTCATVYRYVFRAEAETAEKTGLIPNTSASGEPKKVFVTTEKIYSASEAEKRLKLGRMDPRGKFPKPTHRIEGDGRNIKFDLPAPPEAAAAGELSTRRKIPVISIEPLAD